MLLPRGTVRLRADLGKFMRRHRQGKLEGVRFRTQTRVAARVAITRQMLSDIERGAAWRGPATLDVLLDVLELGWEHLPHAVETDADPRTFVNDMPGGGKRSGRFETASDHVRSFVHQLGTLAYRPFPASHVSR